MSLGGDVQDLPHGETRRRIFAAYLGSEWGAGEGVSDHGLVSHTRTRGRIFYGDSLRLLTPSAPQTITRSSRFEINGRSPPSPHTADEESIHRRWVGWVELFARLRRGTESHVFLSWCQQIRSLWI